MRGQRHQIQTTTNTTLATGRHGDAGELLSSTTTRRWRVGAVRDGPTGRRRGRHHPSPPPSSWRRWPRASGETSFPASSSAEAAGEAPLLCQLWIRHSGLNWLLQPNNNHNSGVSSRSSCAVLPGSFQMSVYRTFPLFCSSYF
ncbi:uncharacterized protein [Triticum aestivum]|uniref:uncharacterized protein n=1 Tax=Triticum aestivum TaxID=4565 RepID=UPI001D02915A|nr:uncharacterized protein LOC123106218 [Triticum aestivum]